MTVDEIRGMLSTVDTPWLECDGATRIAFSLLVDAGIPCSAYIGSLEVDGKAIPLHFWIELGSGHVVDYKARMWLGESPRVPHGIFMLSEYPNAHYKGENAGLTVMSKELRGILLEGFPPGRG